MRQILSHLLRLPGIFMFAGDRFVSNLKVEKWIQKNFQKKNPCGTPAVSGMMKKYFFRKEQLKCTTANAIK
jgi:hypothetical protein